VTIHCRDCGTAISYAGDGVWIDETDDYLCEESNEPHRLPKDNDG
jgi:hypothetical protein